MKLKVEYNNNDKMECIILECDYLKTISAFKNEISKSIHILPEYIILKHKKVFLDNSKNLCDYNLSTDSLISLQVEVSIQVRKTSKSFTITMEYGDRIEDLKYKYCATKNISNVRFFFNNVCKDSENLRQYLNYRQCQFIALSPVLVRVFFSDNSLFDIEAFENDNIKSIRCILVKNNLIKNKNAILMIRNNISLDSMELIPCGSFDVITIYVGIEIVFHRGDSVSKMYFNVDTKVSYLKEYLAKQLSLKPDMFSLMSDSDYLAEENTVGFYKLIDGSKLQVVDNFKLDIKLVEDEKIVELYVRSDQNVSDIKELLSRKFNIDFNRITLLLYDEELLDGMKLNSLTLDHSKALSMLIREIINDTQDMNYLNNETLPSFDEKADWEKPYILGVNENNIDKIVDIKQSNHICNFVSHENSIDNMIDLHESNLIAQFDEPIKNAEDISLMIVNLSNVNYKNYIPRIVINRLSSIQNLRIVIAQELRINMCGLDIYFVGMNFIGGTLDEHNITNNCSLVLKQRRHLRNHNEQFVLNVRNKTGHVSKYMIDDFLTGQGLKNILRKEYDVNISRIQVILDGGDITDDVVIRELDIPNNSIATLIILPDEAPQSEEIILKLRNYLNNGDVGNICNIRVNASDSVGVIRDQIQSMCGLSTEDFVLSYAGEILKMNNQLNTYLVDGDDEIVVSESVLVRYFVGGNNNSAKVNRYAVVPGDTVSSLKSRIHQMLNVQPRFINLSYSGNNLEDDVPLEQYGVENNSYIMMISTLVGGDWLRFVECLIDN